MKRWYVNINRKVQGPFDDAAIRRLIKGGELKRTDLIMEDGKKEWRIADEVPEIAVFWDTQKKEFPEPPKAVYPPEEMEIKNRMQALGQKLEKYITQEPVSERGPLPRAHDPIGTIVSEPQKTKTFLGGGKIKKYLIFTALLLVIAVIALVWILKPTGNTDRRKARVTPRHVQLQHPSAAPESEAGMGREIRREIRREVPSSRSLRQERQERKQEPERRHVEDSPPDLPPEPPYPEEVPDLPPPSAPDTVISEEPVITPEPPPTEEPPPPQPEEIQTPEAQENYEFVE